MRAHGPLCACTHACLHACLRHLRCVHACMHASTHGCMHAAREGCEEGVGACTCMRARAAHRGAASALKCCACACMCHVRAPGKARHSRSTGGSWSSSPPRLASPTRCSPSASGGRLSSPGFLKGGGVVTGVRGSATRRHPHAQGAASLHPLPAPSAGHSHIQRGSQGRQGAWSRPRRLPTLACNLLIPAHKQLAHQAACSPSALAEGAVEKRRKRCWGLLCTKSSGPASTGGCLTKQAPTSQSLARPFPRLNRRRSNL